MSNHMKIIIVDDHKIFRKGLKMVINSFPDTEVIAEASNGNEFINIIKKTDADIIFMDINMPELNGYETTLKTIELKPDMKIIAMSANEDISSINQMLYAGVEGYITKNADYDEIQLAIKKVSQGKHFFSDSILETITEKTISKKKIKVKTPKLSKREKSVLQGICEGLSKDEIADKLFISDRTVEKHKQNLFAKTKTKNAVNLVIYAIKNNIVKINTSLN